MNLKLTELRRASHKPRAMSAGIESWWYENMTGIDIFVRLPDRTIRVDISHRALEAYMERRRIIANREARKP